MQSVSLEHNVTDTLGKVTSGEADAAFVYRADVAAAGDAVETIDIPHAEEYRNAIMAAVVTSTPGRGLAPGKRECVHVVPLVVC